MLSKNNLGAIFLSLGLVGYYYETYNILKSILYFCLFEFVITNYFNSKTLISPQDWVIFYMLIFILDNFSSISLLNARLIFYANISDIFQQLIGKKWGKRKNIIPWSPNKTIEGYIGGGVCMLFVSYVSNISIIYYPIGICGDLLFSFSKRQMGIKDWSNILGSHGGFLDRFNSSIISLFYNLLTK